MARKRGASRGGHRTPPSLWLFSGILIGLGLSWFLMSRGYLPVPQHADDGSTGPIRPDGSETALVDELESIEKKPERPQYDFFTVLPEMEVVVPEDELNVRSQPDGRSPAEGNGARQYLLQVGSFRQLSDADEMKARLALLGIVAQIQEVKVNDATWHRVRVGPVEGARAADEIRGQLTEHGIDSLVMQSPSTD